MTEYLDRYPTMHEYAEGKRINPKLTDLISRADAIDAVMKHKIPFSIQQEVAREIDALPPVETHEIRTETHGVCLISKDDAMGAVQDHFNANGFKGYDDGQKMMDRIKALPSADAVQGDGRNNIKRYPNCQMRTSLGNCDAIGGFCTSINAPICDAFHKLSKAVQGEWIDIDNYYRMATCSRCHKVTMFEKWGEYTKPYDFCPNCGARMKGGDDE